MRRRDPDVRRDLLTWGAAQAGIAAGVMDAVAEGLVTDPEELVLIAAVWGNPEAADADLVYANNRAAACEAIRAGETGVLSVDDALAARHAPGNPYYTPPGDS